MRGRFVAFAMVVLVACSSAARVSHQPTVTPSPALSPLRAPSDRCGDPSVSARAFWFTAADGTPLDGVMLGSGPKGLVLLHQYPSDLCGWWPYAASMANHGYHVLLFDFRCYGKSTCPRPLRGRYIDDVRGAVSTLHRAGATKIAVMGASLGAVVALMAGAALGSPVRAIVSVSAEPDLSYLGGSPPLAARATVPQLRLPTLYLVSRGDLAVTVAETQDMYEHTAATKKRIIVHDPTFGHGWDMFNGSDPATSRAGREVTAFLDAYLT